MARYTPTFLTLLLFIPISVANDIDRSYMSIQHNILFKPDSIDYVINKFTSVKEILCPAMCLHVVGCQSVMFYSIDRSCTVYNSTAGKLTVSNGYTIYVPKNTMITATSTAVEPTTITTIESITSGILDTTPFT